MVCWRHARSLLLQQQRESIGLFGCCPCWCWYPEEVCPSSGARAGLWDFDINEVNKGGSKVPSTKITYPNWTSSFTLVLAWRAVRHMPSQSFAEIFRL